MVKELVYRVLKLLYRLKVLDAMWKMEYNGKVFSLNDLYKQGHWSVRAGIKKKYSKIFLNLLNEANVENCGQFFLIIFYNTRHDTDNLVGIAKVFVDTMKGVYIKDDSKQFYKGLLIFPDETIEKGSLEIIIARKK